LSKALIADVSKIQLRSEEFYKESGVEFHLGVEVETVDFINHKLKTKDGKEWEYNKVIFATGGTPKRLPMTGFQTLGNVFDLRGVDDVRKILAAIGENRKKIVVIG
jgi:NADPH-dependent 2,4-dienoyl-CoA reductase/sulfur reductase-like enzyme